MTMIMMILTMMKTKWSFTIRFSNRLRCSLSIAASASISASLVDPCFAICTFFKSCCGQSVDPCFIICIFFYNSIMRSMSAPCFLIVILFPSLIMDMDNTTSAWLVPVTIWLAPTVFKWLYSSYKRSFSILLANNRSPSGWRSRPPARGSCAPTPSSAPRRSQRQPG